MSIDALYRALNTSSTPQTTVEAIMVAVRERGLAALKDAANVERLPGQLRRLSLPRSCPVRLPSEPSHNSAQGKIEPAVDDLWSGKALFPVMPPAPERDGTDAELGPKLRAWDEFKRFRLRGLREVCLLAPLRMRPV
jgi:hypothetical protein